jgi:hypothetical protein
VWYISVPDKAHAWNAYFQHIWPNATTSFFVDGYVMPRKNSFALLSTALQEHPDAYAASAVSTIGFSSRKQQRFQERNTGINGNLFAMTNTAIVCLRESGFRLPRGLYRTDPTMQSFLKLDFKPGSGKANRRRVVVVKEATYDRRAFSPFKLSDLRTQWRRVLRQRQGDLEIQAVRQLLSVRKIDPRQMPDTVRDLIVGWMHESPRQWWVMAAANPLRLLAARHVRAFCDWSAAADPPELVLTVE